MNIRPHSENCQTGQPCRRCYIRDWDEGRRDKRRQRAFKPRIDARKKEAVSLEKVKELQLKGHDNYVRCYAVNKDYMLAVNAEWRRNNPAKIRGNTARHRASKLRATPAWADLSKITEIYTGCPEGMEVDHIIPLQGKDVCGLHVHYNLQYLSPSANRSKGNRLKVG